MTTPYPATRSPTEPEPPQPTPDTRRIDVQYVARWRRTLLVVMPFGVLAFLSAWLLEGPSGQALPLGGPTQLVLAAGLAGLWGTLLLSRRALPAVLLAITGVVSVYFAVKLAWILFAAPSSVDVQAQMVESFFWIPVVYVLSFILPDLRAGRAIAVVFTVAMLLMSLAYVVWTRSIGQDLGVVHALVQMNLANTVFFALTSTFTDLREEHTRTHVRMHATERFALTDPLTTLPNRHHLMERLQARLDAAPGGTPFALLFLDVDGFKVVNDSLGHAGGDALLQRVAERLRGSLRDTDFVARISGDEFVVIADGAATRTEADEVAQRLLSALVRPFELHAHALRISVSIGVAQYPDDARDADTLLRHADSAMYRAKRSGRNGVQHYLGEADQRLHRQRLLERELRDAQQNGELSLAYQSLHDLASGDVRGVEALLRWRHPELGEVPPCDFVPVAEQSGLIVDIGAWVLDEACRQATAWEREGLDGFTVSVNVSPLQFAHPGFVDTLLSALRTHDLAPQRLELELTETIVLQDLGHVAATLTRLQRLGIRIAIDDFGTGYSSLAYLRDLPIDTIKIDRTFVRHLGGAGQPGGVEGDVVGGVASDAAGDVADDTTREDGGLAAGAAAARPARKVDPAPAFAPALVRAIVSLARSLDLEVVAEGVETDAQRDALLALGCHSGQGYRFSRPMRPQDVPAFLAARTEALVGAGQRTAAAARLLS